MIANRQSLPRLCIVSGGGEHADMKGSALRQASALGHSGAVMYQLREKGLLGGRLYELACRLKPLLARSGSLLQINDRADIAQASGADGVHLPESSCPAVTIRKAFPLLLAGQSVHSVRAAREAEKSGIHYLLFGPVFPTPSKERFGPPQGLENLEKVCRTVSIPVYALGGVTPERALACIECGAWGVAALAPFLDAGSLPVTVESYRSYLPT
ncbi:MAG: thiamine phosphate synthase [Chlorobiaceae bacterium]|nr:thiamine phosphate synthase [Chlorobiaceae bacterium]NTW74766.1 thiamine phosphate synthase [Chlorobiaceae bacterium]